MSNILGNGYTVLNPIAPSGVAVSGSSGSGTLSQYNNGQADTISAGDFSKDGNIKKVIAADSCDTVNLGTGWTSSGISTDQTTGITGTLYTSSSGDQLLISGDATVNQSPAASPSATPSASPSPTPSTAPTPAAKTYRPNYFGGGTNNIYSYYGQSHYSPPPIGNYGAGANIDAEVGFSSGGGDYFAPDDLGEI